MVGKMDGAIQCGAMLSEPPRCGVMGNGACADARENGRFALVVEAAPIALILAGPDGRIEVVNRQAERIFGYDRKDLLGQTLEMLMPARFRLGHVALRDGFIADGSSSQMGRQMGCQMGREIGGLPGPLFGLRKDGTEFPVEIGISSADSNGEPMLLASVIDITVRDRIERDKEKHRAELSHSNSELEEFAYAASHDLKAPLRAISHLVEWIGEDIGAAASAETIENLKLLRGRSLRLQLLLDGLLAFSRVGSIKAEPEDVDIAKVVREVIAELSPPPGFEVGCVGKMGILRAPRTAILVVLRNLISNGLIHHDRTEGRITVSMRRMKGGAEFRVTDDGPGILARFHERIFVIFQTLESRDDVESSGIGLAIVKKKVEGHGGRIWVESAPPARGTTIAFTWKEQTT
jgi:PAS domain S-box-containing protein